MRAGLGEPSGGAEPLLIVLAVEGDWAQDPWHFVASSSDVEPHLDANDPSCGYG